jgi:peptidyl-prolyl cis-trans isomerase SurA
MRWWFSAVLLALAAARGADLVDRLAVGIGNMAITESELRRQIRITALINQEEPEFSGPSKREAAERLVDQMLILREMESGRYPQPAADEVDRMMQEFVAGHFAGPGELDKALERYRINGTDLRQHFQRQLSLLRFIDLRFAPAIQVAEGEARRYYEEMVVPEFRRVGQPVPPFEQVRVEVENRIVQEQADRALDEWLGETRKQARITFRKEVFE